VAVKNLRRETETSCGGRPGFFPWPTTPFAASHYKSWLWLCLNGMNLSRYNVPEESPRARLRGILARKIRLAPSRVFDGSNGILRRGTSSYEQA
jgi:hypothetical protein